MIKAERSTTVSFQKRPKPSRLCRLYRFHQLPEYLKDNDFIEKHYRANYTFTENWLSLFFLHNESGNIWTHLLAFIIFAGLLLDIYLQCGWLKELIPEYNYSISYSDKMVLAVFLAGGMIAFIFSSMFHLHYCSSKKVYEIVSCLDYSGISALMFSSASTVNYYLFYCNRIARNFWLCLLVFVNSVGIIGPYTNFWYGARFRPVRTLLYITSGSFILGPMTHYFLIVEPSWKDHIPAHWMGIAALPLSVLVYLCGAFLYVLRIPERFAPGKFDLFFHSHQWWHCTVFFGAYVHLHGVVNWQNWRSGQLCY